MTTATATATAKKITVATVKSFIKKNRAALLIKTGSHFDGMTDCVEQRDNPEFVKATNREIYDHESGKYVPRDPACSSTLGIMGVWFTRRDSCSKFETETHIGFHVYNCCGDWTVAVAK